MTTAGATSSRGVVVTWIAHHGRSERLGERTGLQPVFMPWARPRRPLSRQLLSWGRSAVRTWRVIRALPSGAVVVAVSPPVFNPLVCLAAAGRRRTVVMDAHSGTFNDRRWAWSHRLVRACAHRCAAVLVTNRAVGHTVLGDDARVLVLHDPLLSHDVPPASEGVGSRRRPYVVFPASGAPDEPIAAVVQAAELLNGEVDVLVTGTPAPASEGGAVRFAGYLPQRRYLAALQEANAVLALTTREGTMQRAAYEALEMGGRLVCSDTEALRTTFGSFADYAANDAEHLADAVRRSLRRPRERCREQAQQLRLRLNAEGADALALLQTGQPAVSARPNLRGTS